MSEQYIGQIIAVGFNFRPSGWAFANGTLMQVSQNQALFSLLGKQFGGDGVSTFGLPDLRSRAPVGFYTTGGTQPVPLTSYIVGQINGHEQVTLTIPQMPLHNHTGALSGGGVSTSASFNASQLSATTAINVATGIPPASRLQTPVGNVLTLPSVAVGGGAVNAYAAPNTGTAGTMATGAATTTFPNAPIAVSASSQFTPPNVTIGNTGGASPISVVSPLLAINYLVCLNGIYPVRD